MVQCVTSCATSTYKETQERFDMNLQLKMQLQRQQTQTFICFFFKQYQFLPIITVST